MSEREARKPRCPCGAVGPCVNPRCHLRTGIAPGGESLTLDAKYLCTCGPNEYCAADDCHGARSSEIALGILSAALGEPHGWALWNRWTAEERNEIAEFAEVHFGPLIRSLADELISWRSRYANT